MALNLTVNWQMAKILTDNWHLPHTDPLWTNLRIAETNMRVWKGGGMGGGPHVGCRLKFHYFVG